MDIVTAINTASEVIILERQNYSNDAHLAFDLSIAAILDDRPDDADSFRATADALYAKAEALTDIHGPILSVFGQL